MSAKRTAARICLIIAAVIIAAVLYIFLSPQVFAWTFARYAPKTLQVKSVKGRLAGPIEMTGVVYDSPTQQASIDDLRANWSPLALFALRFEITDLEATGVQVKAKPAPSVTVKKKFQLPQIHMPPIKVLVDKAIMKNIIYTPAPANKKPTIITQINFRADTSGNTLYVRRLDMISPEYSFTLNGRVQPSHGYPLSVKMAFRAAVTNAPAMSGSGSIDGSLSKELHLQETINPPYPVKMVFTATNLLDNTPAWNGSVNWQSIRWPLAGAPKVTTTGVFSTSGTLQNYIFGMNADLLMAATPQHGSRLAPGRGSVNMKGNGNASGLLLDTFTVDLPKGRLRANGKVNWKPVKSWKLILTGAGLDPSQFSPNWKGDINFNAQTIGRIPAPGQKNINFALNRLSGNLRGRRLGGGGRILITNNDYKIPRFAIRLGRAVISASGSITRIWNLIWRINIPSVSTIMPDAKGTIAANGFLSGPRAKPTAVARIAGNDIQYSGKAVGALQASMKIDMSKRTPSGISAALTGVTFNGRKISSIKLNGSGKPSAHRITLTIAGQAAKNSLSLALAGGLVKKEKIWDGELVNMIITEKGQGTWRLKKPAHIKAGKTLAQLKGLCLVSGHSNVCLSADYKKNVTANQKNPPVAAEAHFSAADVQLGMINPMLPPGASVKGKFGGKGDIYYSTAKGISGGMDLRAQNGAIEYVLQQSAAILSFKDGAITLNTAQEKAAQAATLFMRLDFTPPSPGVAGGDLESKLTVTTHKGSPPAQAGLQGYFRMLIPNLGLLPAIMPSISKASGQMRADINLSGTLGQPSVGGFMALENASMTVPTLGITLANSNLKATGAGKNKFLIDGVFHSGKGQIQLKGNAGYQKPQGLSVNMAIKGQNFQAVKRPDADALISPDLTLKMYNGISRAGGTLKIPQANLKPITVSGAVTPSPDVVIMRKKQGPAAKKAVSKFYADIKVILGNRIFFNGFGLNSRISGNLAIHEKPQRLPMGYGQLIISKGKYTAYKQPLNIENGKLLFAGPVDDPGLDIRASRTINNIVAGVNVTGTLKTPKITIFSQPPMDQADALSYLVLGKPLHSASASQGNMLYSAASTLGIVGGNLLAKRIGGFFGIKEITVQKAAGPERARLYLGKNLSPRLYIGYGIGLFVPSSVFRVRYGITKNWFVEAESGAETGVNMLYNIQWGRAKK